MFRIQLTETAPDPYLYWSNPDPDLYGDFTTIMHIFFGVKLFKRDIFILTSLKRMMVRWIRNYSNWPPRAGKEFQNTGQYFTILIIFLQMAKKPRTMESTTEEDKKDLQLFHKSCRQIWISSLLAWRPAAGRRQNHRPSSLPVPPHYWRAPPASGTRLSSTMSQGSCQKERKNLDPMKLRRDAISFRDPVDSFVGIQIELALFGKRFRIKIDLCDKSTLIFKCPDMVVWFGNLPPPFILPPPFGILNGGGLNKKNEYLDKKNDYLNKKNKW